MPPETGSYPGPKTGPVDFEFGPLSEAKNYRRAVLAEFGEYLRGRVIEVGAGLGQMTELLRQHPGVAQVVAVEPNARFCTQLQAAFPDLPVVEGTIANVPAQAPWHAILSVNVLEHIHEDETELATYGRMLRPQGGVLCLFVPARPEIYAPLDQDFGHFRRYTKPELTHKLRSAGFCVLQCRYFNLAGYFAWWLSFCLLRKRFFSRSAVRWFDRYVFPLVYLVESKLFHPPIGQSLAAVARAEA